MHTAAIMTHRCSCVIRRTCGTTNVSRPTQLASPSPSPPGALHKRRLPPDNPDSMPEPNPVARRRTFAIISHPDAGKTTLTEKMLLFGGAIQLAGEVRAKANRRQTRSDWMGIERERGISVVTSVMTFETAGCVFNLLDTPGHEDFSEDTYRTLTAVDFGSDGDRRRQGHRGAHAQAVRGLPAARHPDRHLHQQDGPRDARSVRSHRRDREDAGARRRAADLDRRPRPIARRRLRHPAQPPDAAWQGRAGVCRQRPRRPARRRAPAGARARRGDRRAQPRRRGPEGLSTSRPSSKAI